MSHIRNSSMARFSSSDLRLGSGVSDSIKLNDIITLGL